MYHGAASFDTLHRSSGKVHPSANNRRLGGWSTLGIIHKLHTDSSRRCLFTASSPYYMHATTAV